MTRNKRQTLILGIMALAAAAAAAAATVSSPLHPTSSPAKASRLAAPGQDALDLDPAALSALRSTSGPFALDGFPIAPGAIGSLDLRRFEVVAPDARITVTGAGGDSTLPFPSVAHFEGRVHGEPDSAVYIGVLEDRLVAYVRSSAGRVYIGPDESHLDYIVRTSDSPANGPETLAPWSCGTEELSAPLTANAEPSYPPPALPDVAGFKQASVRVETDQELLSKFGGNVAGMAGYVATLFGATNVIYERDLALHLTVTEVHAWTTTDPYPGPSTLDLLNQLGDWWHANRPIASYPRTLVHYLSGLPVSGGIAWIGVLCAGDFNQGHWGGAYSLTEVYGTYPLQMWDQMASAHEMGHNSGSVHTHCYVPAIDHCYNQEPGCYNGPVQNPGAGNGTIMSYCHLLGWQYISLVFHPRCISEQMLPEINSAACLVAVPTFGDVPTTHPFFHWIETVFRVGVSLGCGNGNYCPDASVTRAEMAVFLLKAKFGSGHVPPTATGTVFDDVHVGDFAADWIEELASLQITAGCTPSSYCPGAAVTRDQMAVLLLKALYGSAHTPPATSSVFSDVANNDPYEPWIMELYNRGITGGCATGPLRYCPGAPNTRGEMAVFLVRTFGLSW